jgi:EAL domain-containing protein (putative c-di-GMP-specific phosphodiesterase class I)
VTAAALTPGRHDLLEELFGGDKLRIALHGIHPTSGDSVIGYEALMRGPKGAPYESPPLAFAMAATLDILETLDCRCIARASAIDVDGLLFLNVHPRTIARHDEFWSLLSTFGNELARVPQRVVFEIVEHSAVREAELPRTLQEIRALGFRIAVDDLGEGSAGLRRLVELSPDFAKIDRFFVDGIDRDPKRRAVVAAIASIGRELNTRIIAEGVEREDELSVLRDLGVELVQGYLFGRPQEVRA